MVARNSRFLNGERRSQAPHRLAHLIPQPQIFPLAVAGREQRIARHVVAEHHALPPVQREQMSVPASERTRFRQRRIGDLFQLRGKFLRTVNNHFKSRWPETSWLSGVILLFDADPVSS